MKAEKYKRFKSVIGGRLRALRVIFSSKIFFVAGVAARDSRNQYYIDIVHFGGFSDPQVKEISDTISKNASANMIVREKFDSIILEAKKITSNV